MTQKPNPGDKIVLAQLPPGLLEGQEAISESVGTQILLNEYDDHGRAELQLTAKDGVIHFIWVDPKFLASPEQHLTHG